jgi:DNA-binding response OmpR family regulator
VSTTVLLAAGPETSEPLEGPLRDHGFEIAGPGARADVVIAGEASEVERLSAEAPVILLGGADDAPVDRVLAFRRGCDDYVARPFHHEELVERIRAVLRRRRTAEPRVLYVGELRVDEVSRIATLRDVALRLSQRELSLLAVLASEPTRVFTRPELLRWVWNWPESTTTRTVETHASRLRRKLRAVDPDTPWIDNEWGVGYRLIGLHCEIPARRQPLGES